jgi:hypothetical protein
MVGMTNILMVTQEGSPLQAVARNYRVGLAVARGTHLTEIHEAALVGECYSIEDARVPVWPGWLRNARSPLNEQDMARLQQWRFAATAMIDRRNLTGASVMAVDRLINAYADVWSAVLDAIGPTVVLFHHPPHRGWDLVLMALAESRDIPVAIVGRTLVGSRLMVYSSIESGPMLNWCCEEEAGGGEEIGRGWDGPRSSYVETEMELQRTRGVEAALQGRPVVEGGSIGDYLRKLKAPIHLGLQKFPDGVPSRRHTGFRRRLSDVEAYVRIRSYARKYMQLCSEGVPETGFVLLALHYQPEGTTLPMALRYLDQLRVARRLCEELPEGTVVAIKEHYQMFRHRLQWLRARDDAFVAELESLVAMGNVIVRPDVPSDALIDGCQAVATGTGSVGWEALKKGSPVLAFGLPWYASAPGCEVIRSDVDVGPCVRKALTWDGDELRRQVEAWTCNTLRKSSFVGPWSDQDTVGSEGEKLKEAYARGIGGYLSSAGIEARSEERGEESVSRR